MSVGLTSGGSKLKFKKQYSGKGEHIPVELHPKQVDYTGFLLVEKQTVSILMPEPKPVAAVPTDALHNRL